MIAKNLRSNYKEQTAQLIIIINDQIKYILRSLQESGMVKYHP